MCAKVDPLSHFKRLQMGIFGFSQKETGAKSVAMATTVGVMYVLVPSLKNIPIFQDIFLVEYCTVLVEPAMTPSLSSFA